MAPSPVVILTIISITTGFNTLIIAESTLLDDDLTDQRIGDDLVTTEHSNDGDSAGFLDKLFAAARCTALPTILFGPCPVLTGEDDSLDEVPIIGGLVQGIRGISEFIGLVAQGFTWGIPRMPDYLRVAFTIPMFVGLLFSLFALVRGA